MYSSTDGKDVFQKVNIPTDGTYFQTNFNFDTPVEKAEQLANSLPTPTKVVESTEVIKQRTGIDNKVGKDNKAIVRQVIEQLNRTGLARKVHILSPKEMNNTLKSLGVDSDIRKQITSWHGSPHKFDRFSTDFMGKGEGIQVTPNGFVYNNEVFLNESVLNSNTAIHEFGHLYSSMLKNTNTPLYNKGLSLIEQEGQVYIDFVKQTQPNLKGEALLEEALAEAVGDFGSKLIESSTKNKFIQFLNDLWNAIKGKLGLSSYTIEEVNNMSLTEYIEAVNTDLLRGERLVQERRTADQLPLTLAVFNRPEFEKMKGKMVNPVTILNSLNQQGIKQIEKDLIKSVIEENYQGQKKVSYDELELKVRVSLMPLERIFTSSYANYGMDNLGDGDYGEANTIILNAPIEHGVTGHFPGDFKASGRKNIKYVPKQLDGNTWVAVEEGYESQANNNNIYQFVGTAGTKEAVEAWIENYSSVKPFYVADKSSIKNPIKFFDTYKEAKKWATENGENLTAEYRDWER